MRDIEFRGKRVSDDKWIYGYMADMESINNVNEVATPCEEVDPDTIGQWTGLYDTYGKKIYEDDIVECVSWNEYFSDGTGKPMEPFRRRMYIKFTKGAFKMVESMPHPMTDNEWDIIYNGDVEVIGNIHDNYDLLKK